MKVCTRYYSSEMARDIAAVDAAAIDFGYNNAIKLVPFEHFEFR